MAHATLRELTDAYLAPRPGEIAPFESREEIDAIAAELDGISGLLVVFLAGTGVRPEEGFGAASTAPAAHGRIAP